MTKLKFKRMQQGLSQSQLAKKSDVNYRMLQRYEQGSADINKANILTIYRLSLALNCNAKDILSDDKIIKILTIYESRYN